MKIIFFDTEFNNFADLDPLSIGFVSECENFKFYNENTQYNLPSCSDFVKKHVITKLDLDKYGHNKAGIRKNFENWVNHELDDNYLLFVSDYDGDIRIFWKLFSDLNTEKRIQTKLLSEAFSLVSKERLLYDHKKLNKCSEILVKEIGDELNKKPEMIHHSLYDAICNCRGFKKALDFLKN